VQLVGGHNVRAIHAPARIISVHDAITEPLQFTSGRGRSRLVMYTVLYMPSTRTQIYLTDDLRRRLDARGRRTGAPMARLIREAVEAYLADDSAEIEAALDETFGAMPELELPNRDEWDRGADPG